MAIPLANVSSTGQVIAEWTVGQKTICLFRKPTCLAYSLGGPEGQTTTFKPALYSIDYAVNLIQMFHRTIRTNLENEDPHSSCFLPILCREVQNASGKQAALFGRVDASTVASGELKGLRWGIFNAASKEEQIFQVTDSVTKTFIRRAPGTNRPHLETVLDKNQKPIQKPATDHYAMNAYAKRFSVSLVFDNNSQIQSVAMYHVSLLDRNVLLDENNWAITLVSAMDSTQSAISQFFRGQFGHAMLACEGVRQNEPFLRYIHLTRNPVEKTLQLKSDEAQVESFERDSPLHTFNGPTWSRPRMFIENMFHSVVSLQGVAIKFTLYGQEFASFQLSRLKLVASIWNYDDFLKKVETEMIPPYRATEYNKNMPRSCLEAAILIASKAGIIFCGPYIPFQTPIEKIKKVRVSPIEKLPLGFDYACLGKPFSEANLELSKRILSACVLLSPEDCPPNLCEHWAQQWWEEHWTAVKRERDRYRNATTLSEMVRSEYSGKRW